MDKICPENGDVLYQVTFHTLWISSHLWPSSYIPFELYYYYKDSHVYSILACECSKAEQPWLTGQVTHTFHL